MNSAQSGLWLKKRCQKWEEMSKMTNGLGTDTQYAIPKFRLQGSLLEDDKNEWSLPSMQS